MPYLAVEGIYLLGYGVHLQTQSGCGLVDEVYGLVGQKPRGDVAVREFDGRDNRLVLDSYLMMIFVTLLQSSQNRYGIVGRRLIDHNLLESAFQSLVLLEVFLKFVQRGRSDCAQFATRQRRFENVCRIHRAVGFAGTDEGVNLVDEEQYLSVARNNFLHDPFQTLLEFALIFRTRNQCAHVERIDDLRFQIFRHVAIDYSVGYTLGNGCFADARFTDQNRVVLGTARENLQHPPNLLVAADYGV